MSRETSSARGTVPRAAEIVALFICCTVVLLDQATKAIVRSAVIPGDQVKVFPGLELVNIRNPGIAFGVFAGGGSYVLILTACSVAAVLVFFVTQRHRPLVWLPTGLLLGGAIGNAIDRIRESSVTDFIKLPHWPAFNIADSAITVGVLALMYVLLSPSLEEGESSEPQSPAEQGNLADANRKAI